MGPSSPANVNYYYSVNLSIELVALCCILGNIHVNADFYTYMTSSSQWVHE
jgi:hypothetical protein